MLAARRCPILLVPGCFGEGDTLYTSCRSGTQLIPRPQSSLLLQEEWLLRCAFGTGSSFNRRWSQQEGLLDPSGGHSTWAKGWLPSASVLFVQVSPQPGVPGCRPPRCFMNGSDPSASMAAASDEPEEKVKGWGSGYSFCCPILICNCKGVSL